MATRAWKRPLTGWHRQHVTLVEFADQLKADAVLVNKLKSPPNVTIHVNAQTTEITGDGQKVNGLSYKPTAPRAMFTTYRWKACLCRLAWCPTPNGSRARWS